MKISLYLLKTFIETPLKAEELAEVLTDIGLEVEGISHFSSVKGGLKGLVVGEVLAADQHPNADKLKLTKVNTGNGEELQIVCGAPNVEKGQKVVVAKVGATIYPLEGEPFEIKKAKIRGESSYGMICAEDEIGTGNSHEGIIVLPNHAIPGDSLQNYIPVFEDTIFEIGLTPNRPDAMSHSGIARDLYAALKARKQEVRLISVETEKLTTSNSNKEIKIQIENEEACPVYSGLFFKNISVSKSPKWLQNQLKSLGVKPINNIVDITNLVLKEYGQPLHAFNADKIEGKTVIIRNAHKGEKITTLDEKVRDLHHDDLVICDARKPLCIAGVFGGIDSGVKTDTTSIFLESAYFSPAGIRKTAQRHTLQTDAAQRYEKGADPEITLKALERAAYLFITLASAEIQGNINHQAPNKPNPFNVDLRVEKVNKLLGTEIDKLTIKHILEDLDIKIVKEKENTFRLEVPCAKADVTREVDVIEEIARIYGFNQIPEPEEVKMKLPGKLRSNADLLYQHLAKHLSGLGFFELNTNSISRSTFYDENDKALVKILKSANSELDVLRKDLYHNVLEIIEYNKNRKNHDLKFFELGKVYSKVNEEYKETNTFTLWSTGKKLPVNWKQQEESADFYFLKSIAERVLSLSGVQYFSMQEYSDNVFKNGIEYFVNNFSILKIGTVEATLLQKFDIEGDVYYAEFDWEFLSGFYKSGQLTYKEISKFPSIYRDLSLLIDNEITFGNIKSTALKNKSGNVQSIDLFDIYKGKGIPEDKISYAIRIHFQHPEKTLTDKEVDKEIKKMIYNLETGINAKIRQ